MNADRLRVPVAEHFTTHAAAFGLEPAALVVEYVLNWGGFVNFSYHITDGQRAYHLKLARPGAYQEALRRWLHIAPLLQPYHAPRVLEWIDLGDAAGPLFPHLAGSPPALSSAVVDELVPVLRKLNADRDIAAVLQTPETVTARDAYMTSFHVRFTEDLRGIRDARPQFIGADLLRRLEDEVAVLAQTIATAPAFDEPLTRPVHGDLWLNNVLWVDSNEWSLLDWDDVRIGDPAADVASLSGPSARDLRPLKMRERLSEALTGSERQRLPLLGRATLLDWVIDPVSDWIDAGVSPEHERGVRVEKERVHKAALACYEEIYGRCRA